MPCTKYTALDWISTCHECLKRFFASSQGSYAQSNPRKHDEPAESSSRPPHADARMVAVHWQILDVTTNNFIV